MSYRHIHFAVCNVIIFSIALAGCGEAKPAPGSQKQASTNADEKANLGKPISESTKPQSSPNPKFEAVTLGEEVPATSATSNSVASEKEQMESVVAAMQPLQIMLGKWRGTTNKEFKGFKKVDEVEWIWDFRTSRAEPALVVTSDKSPYIREGRLTYLPSRQQFQFTATTPEGAQHVMTGKFQREPEEVTGDDNKPQKTYQLVLTEPDAEGADTWQVTFDQQENNRYLLKVARKRGQSFQLVDTTGTQRLGTSVAANDEDYGERKCIISGGLGTMTVSYNDKTYWVCCTGCLAAFNDDPKRWLAKMAEADKAKKP
jgi:hypothetical protein